MTNEADVCLPKISHSQERFPVNVEQRVSKKLVDGLRGSAPWRAFAVALVWGSHKNRTPARSSVDGVSPVGLIRSPSLA